MQVKEVRFLTATNDFDKKEQRHGVTIFMTARLADDKAVAEVCEPEKCEGWRWQGFRAVVDNHRRFVRSEPLVEEYFQPLYSMIDQAPEAVETVLNWKA